MKIALDAMGGDFGPKSAVEGALHYAGLNRGRVLLVGDPDQIKPLIPRGQEDGLEIVEAKATIDMDDHPVKAVLRKTDASVVVAATMVKQGLADAFVSAGNTGAAMTAAVLHMGRIPGIDRPAIVSPIPVPTQEAILLDAGANVDCRPHNLLQFAGMGRAYMQKVRGIAEPTIGLLNIGQESSKGNELTIKTYKLLEKSGWNFIGNIEGRQIFSGEANVVICDGFVGNVVLKVSEGLGGLILGHLSRELISEKTAVPNDSPLQTAFGKLKSILDYKEYGGAPLLGVDGTAIICHGSSNAQAISNALAVAEDTYRAGLKENIREIASKLDGGKL